MMKPTPVIAVFILLLLCAVPIVLVAKPVSAPAGQVVFEGTGTGVFNSQSMPFGFSVRCYSANCVGALVLGGPTSVSYVTGTVTLVQQDTYMMSVSTVQTATGALPPTNGANISCSLANAPPITQGETNTVTMTCSSPAGSGTSTDATVAVVSPTSSK